MKLMLLWFAASLLYGSDFKFYPNGSYDPSIPTLKQIVGHDWGEAITDHRQMEEYLRALTKASPRIRVVKYGGTWEGRALYYAVIGSPETLARLDVIKAGLQKLAYPERADSVPGDDLIRSLPAVVWLSYSVHGNETSGTEAALLTAYHLLAVQSDPLADQILANALVIIDPLQNPDGRERFIAHFRQTRGRWPDENQAAAEHNEAWPGGRSNHYLFDMNRDWFAVTQPETRARVKAFLEWFPQVFVDLHEMGSNSSYYFAPPAPPINPELAASQTNWHVVFGKNNAAWFDRMNFDYFTREVFDSFYPGYGEGWPMFHGAIGMTYEQASVRGLVVKRDDETVMRYRDAIQHHFIASLSTIETTAKRREELLRHFFEVRRSGLEDGRKNAVKGYVIDPGKDPGRVVKLVDLLMLQGIKVQKAETPFSVRSRDYYQGELKDRPFPAGTYFVPLAQPAKRLVATLLSKDAPMQQEFVKEQERRYKKRLNDEIYDITAWSLPLLYDVDCYLAEEEPANLHSLAEPPVRTGTIHGEQASLAYVLPWGSNSAVRALSRLLSDGIRVYSSDKPFVQRGVSFPAGTLICKVKDNPTDLHERLAKIAQETGVDIYSTDTGWVESGVNFGSGEVRYLKRPKVALAYQTPTSSTSVGALWFLIEEVYDYPVTLINTRQISSALRDFDVLILPDAYVGSSYQAAFGEEGARGIKEWVNLGGTLVTVGEATRWLTEEKVGLLATIREYRDSGVEKGKPESPKEEAAKEKPAGKTEEQSSEKKRFNLEKAIEPEKELPGVIPGAIMRVRLDTEHWLAFGYTSETNVLVASRNIFTPLKLDKGQNVGLYLPADKVLVSGFSWNDARNQLGEKAFLLYERNGQGNVVAFAEDPNFRAFTDGLNLLLFNAIFLGPAHGGSRMSAAY